MSLNYINIDPNLNIIKDIYIRNNLNIEGTLDININLLVSKIEGFKKFSVGNACFIDENMSIYKDLKWIRHEKYPFFVLVF